MPSSGGTPAKGRGGFRQAGAYHGAGLAVRVCSRGLSTRRPRGNQDESQKQSSCEWAGFDHVGKAYCPHRMHIKHRPAQSTHACTLSRHFARAQHAPAATLSSSLICNNFSLRERSCPVSLNSLSPPNVGPLLAHPACRNGPALQQLRAPTPAIKIKQRGDALFIPRLQTLQPQGHREPLTHMCARALLWPLFFFAALFSEAFSRR
jgi:hypothetical protein